MAALEVARAYFALLARGHDDDARRLWSEAGGLGGMSEVVDVESFTGFRAELGEPGRIEGAAGSLYIEIPVYLVGRNEGGTPFDLNAVIFLSRSNNVPGSTEEQRRWRIRGVYREPPTG